MKKIQPIITKELPHYPIDEEVEEELCFVGGISFLSAVVLLTIIMWGIFKLI